MNVDHITAPIFAALHDLNIRPEERDPIKRQIEAALSSVKVREALATLLNNSAVITKPGSDPCFVDLQCRSKDYEAAYNALTQ